MTFKTRTVATSTKGSLLFNSNIAFVLMRALILAVAMSTSTSSAAQIVVVSSPAPEDYEIIDGTGIINTPNHNSSSALPNIPYIGTSDTPLPIGRLCEHDSDCGKFSICRLVVSDQETTKKICQCDNKEMKLVNDSCYIKPGHQCYFPNKNSHGYRFIKCFPGSVCKSSVNKTAPRNGYCMCEVPSVDDHYRYVNAEFEMARCSANSMTASLGCLIFWMVISVQGLFGFI